MVAMIAYCGLKCDNCPVQLATMESDISKQQSMRESIAEECSRLYGMVMKPRDIADCDGCLSMSGRLFSGCLKCEIRKCASLKNIENCASCSEYACGKLSDFFSGAPIARTRLDEIRKGFN